MIGLLLGRLRHARSRWLAMVAGLALAVVLPVLAGAISATTEQAALRRGVEALPPGQRVVAVSYDGLPDASALAGLDRPAVTALARLGSDRVRREMIFREISDQHGDSFVLGAADHLGDGLRLTSGRLPVVCTPVHCEVVALAEPGRRRLPPVDQGLGLVVVATAVRTDPLLLTGGFDPGPDVPILLADGVSSLASLASLDQFGRSYGWVGAVNLDAVRALGVQGWVARTAAVGDDLARARPGLVLSAPDDALAAADTRARVSAARFGLLGGSTAVLLLGGAVVGGAGLRRDHEAFVGALRRRGAPAWRIALVVVAEVVAAVLAACVTGLVSGTVGAALIAHGAGLPTAATAGSALLGALPAVAGTAAAGAPLLAATLMIPAGRAGSALAWRCVEAGAAVCLAAAALLIARGGVGANTAGQGGVGDPLLAVLPALALAAAGLLLARLWPALTAVVSRHLPRTWISARLGVAAAATRPLRPAATAALLTAAVAAGIFSLGYRDTLRSGADDQAAYAVPLDARLLAGAALELPLDVLTPQVRAGLGGTAYPLLRTAASIRVAAQQGDAVQVIGLDPAVLPRIRRWAATVGSSDPVTLARRLSVPWLATDGGQSAGTPLPAGRILRLDVTGTGDPLSVTAYVRAPDGRERGVDLVMHTSAGGGSLTGDLSAASGALRDAVGAPAALDLVAIVARQPVDAATRRQHRLGEGGLDAPAPSGRLTLGAVDVDGSGVRGPWRGWAGDGLSVGPGGDSARLAYRLAEGAAVLTGRPLPASAVLPVAADARTAAAAGPDGLVTLTLAQTPVTVRVVAALPRFPTVQTADEGGDPRFVVADLGAVSRALDAAEPGSGEPGELWWDGPLPADPFVRLDVQAQSALRTALRTDPVAVGASVLLELAAGLTLAVGAAALVLLVVAERADDAGEAYAWEADGVAPGTLRGALWWRAASVVTPAVPAGVVAGGALSAVTARLIAVTATASTPQPPLASGSAPAWGLLAWGAVLAVATAMACLALCAGVAAASLREPMPVRGGGWSS